MLLNRQIEEEEEEEEEEEKGVRKDKNLGVVFNVKREAEEMFLKSKVASEEELRHAAVC